MTTWKFNESVVPVFDQHVRDHVPMYEEFHKMIIDLSGWFLENNTSVYDIGTSTGEVIRNLKNCYPHKQLNYFGIDISNEMVKEAQNRFSHESDVLIKNEDVTNPQFEINNASVVLSVLTLMFIKKNDRQNLVNKIYNGLNDGGAFIFVEKVVGNNADFDRMFMDLYHDFKINNGLDEKQVFEKAKSIRGVLRPKTLLENLDMIKKAGFENVDVFFKWNNFAGIIAVK